MKEKQSLNKGKIIYIEPIKILKKRNLEYSILFVILILVFFIFLLKGIFLFFEGNQLPIYFLFPLFLFILIISTLYFKNRRRLIIYENWHITCNLL